jgi:hypothetical protein
MNVKDMLLTKDEIQKKYVGKGSPDYPTHPEGCPCSGCYASWTEWRGAHQVVEKLRSSIKVSDKGKEKLRNAIKLRMDRDVPPDGQIQMVLHYVVGLLENQTDELRKELEES